MGPSHTSRYAGQYRYCKPFNNIFSTLQSCKLIYHMHASIYMYPYDIILNSKKNENNTAPPSDHHQPPSPQHYRPTTIHDASLGDCRCTSRRVQHSETVQHRAQNSATDLDMFELGDVDAVYVLWLGEFGGGRSVSQNYTIDIFA